VVSRSPVGQESLVPLDYAKTLLHETGPPSAPPNSLGEEPRPGPGSELLSARRTCRGNVSVEWRSADGQRRVAELAAPMQARPVPEPTPRPKAPRPKAPATELPDRPASRP
jgi:hypothetical protein